ncbi:uncharacterized protein JCM6883_001564 [Sporobolomyces salmoneus]|uniref:uncharacterized protein n=1 Tax=Sporobolomyces salmoneus TaxID=183962 RepID=UPI003179CA28
MPKFPPRDNSQQTRQKKPYTQRSAAPRKGPKPPPSAPVISKSHKEQQQSQQSQSLDLTGQSLTEPPNLAKDHPRLGKLNLTDCGLTSITWASQVKNTLTWLNVSGNKLRDKSAWQGIEQLKTLFVLNASHCELTEVPQCVSSLQSLKALVLSHNSLTSLEHIRNLPDLNTIVVSNNQLTSLPSTLTSLPSLKKISASHNLLTSSGLPNLSSLSHLHELRFSHNANLTSLPSHFGGWGKQPLPPGSQEDSERDNGRRRRGGGGGVINKRQGIEILDLSSCGFENWYGLRAIAEQDGIVNLGLKGNKVALDAMGEGEGAAGGSAGFEEFKSKLTILLPNLRILDSIRFDAKHFELKTLRAARTPEQALLDAGPMALELLAKKSKEDKEKIELEKVEAILREKEREKENKRRRRKGLEELGDGSRRKEREERLKKEREEQGAEEVNESVEESSEPRKKTKDTTKGKRKSSEPAPSTSASGPPQSNSARKRAKKEQKSTGGVLDALKADPSEPVGKKVTKDKAAESVTKEKEQEKEGGKREEKQKTSVLKVIEVKKSKDKAKGRGNKAEGSEGEMSSKQDVGELLGLGKKKEEPAGGEKEEKKVGVFDMLGSSAGTGVFGGSGWD